MLYICSTSISHKVQLWHLNATRPTNRKTCKTNGSYQRTKDACFVKCDLLFKLLNKNTIQLCHNSSYLCHANDNCIFPTNQGGLQTNGFVSPRIAFISYGAIIEVCSRYEAFSALFVQYNDYLSIIFRGGTLLR